ncbi:rho GTPase-activating protein 44-like isoform X2 [Zootermopsis nevadensis]|uniref:rho GTPase-activating protein 44-like isoform X2 n=1 Tax=Zootermopsis nevadensis TaxID=136037 RepID=UPI000B8EA191|nr:rho GTPase-activating protein 44-like isoform X2 [Zootermopsis nevadensis]
MPTLIHVDSDWWQNSSLKMKKQFFRVKQLADQRFSRAGKTEVLSDDLQEADRKVEYISRACGNTSKKMGTLCSGQDASREKRLKKNAEHVLGIAMQDSGSCEEECLLSNILSDCAKIEMNLANEVLDHEMQVEQLVVTPLQQMLDNDVPKHKAKLSKFTLDMDSARTRYQTALKHGSTNTNTIKEELEDAELKVEQCRDMLASEMFQLISKEADLAQTVVQYIKLQRAYHESALRILEETIPELEKTINESPSKPVYGYPLEEHLRVTRRKVASPIELCVCALLELGMEEEGLFRVAGGASKLRRLKMSFDACCLTLPTVIEYRDPHVIAGALKSYLRDLPEPLMTYTLYEEWMAAARIQSSNEARHHALKQVIDKLPQANFDNLRYLIKFLSALSRNQEVNKMTPQNIAIVIAPNLIWSQADETTTMGMNMSSANTYSSIVDSLVNNADWFFPGDIEFFQTFPHETTLINGMTSSTGSVSGLQPHEWTGGSPVEKVATSGHTRGSSSDGQLISLGEPGVMKRTQSNSSLSDHSSPPHGSPKPAARRKNKPAPVPPSSGASPKDLPPSPGFTPEKPEKPPRPAVGPLPSTLPRPNKKHSGEHDVRTADSGTVENIPAVTTEKHQKSSDNISSGIRKQSTDGLEPQQNCMISSMHRKVSSGGGEKLCVDSEKCGEGSESFPSTEQSQTLPPTTDTEATSVTVTSSCASKLLSMTESVQQKNVVQSSTSGCTTLERKHPQRPIPVAAPRNTVNINASNVAVINKEVQNRSSENKTSESVLSGCESTKDVEIAGEHDAVMLRRPLLSDGGERSNNPAVPERPATLLRPHSSFRGSRHSADSDCSSGDKPNTDSERPMLERTHIYSVDKQQVSIIQVGGEKEKTVAVPINNNNNEPVFQRSPSIGSHPLSVSLSAFCIDFQTKDNALKSQSDLRTLKMQRPVLKEGSTSLVIPGPCQKGTFSTSTQISQP